jgi:hypothetical protein
LTAAAGVGVMIALVSLASGWPTESPRQPLLNFAFIMHLLMIPVATAWLVWRRRYMRLPRAIQWVGAGVAIATVAAGMVLLAMITD